jgi:hypothetical protein
MQGFFKHNNFVGKFAKKIKIAMLECLIRKNQ